MPAATRRSPKGSSRSRRAGCPCMRGAGRVRPVDLIAGTSVASAKRLSVVGAGLLLGCRHLQSRSVAMGGMVMTIEIQMLAWAIALGVLQLLTAATLSSLQRGAKWAVHARDGVAPPLTGLAARMDRAFGNFIETFPFFAAAVLAVLVSGK